MYRLSAAALVAAIVMLRPQLCTAQENALTLDQALTLARERAPTLLSARIRIDEARGRLVGASVLLHENPLVEAAAGPRNSERGRFLDTEIGIHQTFELGGRRGARVAGAEAGVARAVAESEDAARRLLRDVAVAFYRALYAEERLRLATAAEGVAEEIVRIAEQRHQAGDVPLLDVNVSRAALARARSDHQAAEATRSAALGDIRILLGMDAVQPFAVQGDLHNRRRFELRELIAGSSDRPDLRSLDAEAHEADADLRLGKGLAWPDVGLGVRYAREEEANVFLGGLTLALPLLERGQGLRTEASARARRLQLELDAGRRLIDVEVRTAFEVYGRRVDAVTELEQNALPLLDENEALARRSYEAGQIGLAELLLVRREILETRNQHIDRLLEAAVAGIELEASAGALR
jgi:cobalt-zinc-cadmium efflux system outer membrane protein